MTIDGQKVLEVATLLQKATERVAGAGLLSAVHGGALAERADALIRERLREALPCVEEALEKLREIDRESRDRFVAELRELEA
jgi:hypothetical protein